MHHESPEAPRLSPAVILSTWWPLAASWLLMGVEVPMVAAAMSRCRDAETHLAAFGGVTFPLALMIESPVIMMLAASTALSSDHASYRRLWIFMTKMGMTLTVIQALIAFTPLFDGIALRLLGVPAETVDPARLGFIVLLPWTWAIADRRLHQGVLIRFGRQKLVGIGTLVRLVGTGGTLLTGLTFGWPAIVLGTAAMSVGVISELIYVRWCVRPVIDGPLRASETPRIAMSARGLWLFYIPLAMTPLLSLLSMPIGSAGISRMPEALASLAVWPVLNGFVFMMRSVGVAYNEVAVRHAGDPDGARVLIRLAWQLGLALSALVVVVAITPVADWWFRDVSGLDSELTALGRVALPYAALMPLLTFLHSAYQGVLVYHRRTRAITEAVAVFIVTTAVGLIIGVTSARMPGASAAILALTIGGLAQAVWLRIRCASLV